MKLAHKVIFITGASKGIGFELAKQLTNKQNTVVIGGRNQVDLDKISQEFEHIHTFLFDVLNDESTAKISYFFQQKFGRIDVLINNAAVLNSGDFYETAYHFESIETEILTNIASPIKLTKSLLPLLAKQKEAAILNVTSGVAYMPMPSLPVYSATKSALQSFTISLRESLKNTAIKVYEALPPLVNTQMTANMNNKAQKMEKMSPARCAELIIEGIETDVYTNNIGSSKSIYWGRRLFPKMVQKQLNKM